MSLLKYITVTGISDISEEKVEELKHSVLSQMFNDLSSKSLSDELYESLLNEAEICATIFRNLKVVSI